MCLIYFFLVPSFCKNVRLALQQTQRPCHDEGVTTNALDCANRITTSLIKTKQPTAAASNHNHFKGKAHSPKTAQRLGNEFPLTELPDKRCITSLPRKQSRRSKLCSTWAFPNWAFPNWAFPQPKY